MCAFVASSGGSGGRHLLGQPSDGGHDVKRLSPFLYNCFANVDESSQTTLATAHEQAPPRRNRPTVDILPALKRGFHEVEFEVPCFLGVQELSCAPSTVAVQL